MGLARYPETDLICTLNRLHIDLRAPTATTVLKRDVAINIHTGYRRVDKCAPLFALHIRGKDQTHRAKSDHEYIRTRVVWSITFAIKLCWVYRHIIKQAAVNHDVVDLGDSPQSQLAHQTPQIFQQQNRVTRGPQIQRPRQYPIVADRRPAVSQKSGAPNKLWPELT